VWQYIYKKLEKWFSIDNELSRLEQLHDKAFIAIYQADNWIKLQAAHKLLLRLEKESKYYGDLTFQKKINRLKLQWLNKYFNWKRYL
jgi:hypothetical protein